jgi:phosphatidylglycerophosphate synthase
MQDDGEHRRPIPERRSKYAIAFAGWLTAKGISPNQISLFGLGAGVASGFLLALTPVLPGGTRALLIASAVMVLLRGLSNMFDGMVAVEHGRGGPLGLLYNEIPDRISDIALMVGTGYAVGGHTAAGWAAACVALFITYIRAVGALAGAPEDFSGPMAKQQRMFSIAGAALYLGVTPASWHPSFGAEGQWGLLALVLWIIVAGGILTAGLRVRRAVRALDGGVAGRQAHQ